MTVVGLILAHYWKPLSMLALLAALLIYRGMLVWQRDQARAQAAQLVQENAGLRASNQAFGAEVERQNAAVIQLQREADAAANTMAANERGAAAAGLAAQAEAQRQAKALSAAPIAPNSGCEGAVKWANAQAAELATW